jgi:spore coat protein CotH
VINRLTAGVCLVCATLVGSGCGSGGGSSVASNKDLETASLDTSGELFDPDRLLSIDIEMNPADYDVLRYEGRSLSEVFSGCISDYQYTHFEAQVSVDGKSYDRVDIRKKGFLGSLSASRPSFKLDFDDLRPGRAVSSMEKLTLNNNNQDRGNTHQCLTYELFRRAGLVAPRCNFARVTMNGQDLGIYTNVESIDKPFLRRNFRDDEGNLYESQVGGDFGEYLKDYFQLKTNLEDNDRRDLDRVVEALRADDESMPSLVDEWVDLDEFLSYWAMEGITGHWDSATGNANNHFMYHDPSDGRFRYIPWGADGAFELFNPLSPGTGPLYRYTLIPSRLYGIESWRAMYHERVLQLLDTVWDGDTLLAEIDRIRDLTGTPEEELESVRQFVALHPDRVRAAVAGELEQRERTIVDEERSCSEPQITTIEGSFANGFANYRYLDADGNPVDVVGVASPPDDQGLIPIGNGISITIFGQSGSGTRILLLSIEAGEFGPGEIPLHGISTTIFLIGQGEDGEFGLIGLAGIGTVTLEAPVEIGQPVTGSFSAELWLDDGDGLGPLQGN